MLSFLHLFKLSVNHLFDSSISVLFPFNILHYTSAEYGKKLLLVRKLWDIGQVSHPFERNAELDNMMNLYVVSSISR